MQVLELLVPMLNSSRPLTFFDLETTGKFAQIDRTVEFFAIKATPDNLQTAVYYNIFNPRMPICAEAAEKHGITNAIAQALGVYFEDQAEGIWAYFKDATLIGYNVKMYDLKLMDEEFKRAKLPYRPSTLPVIDAYKLWLLLERRRLEDAYRRYLGRELEDAHRAADDVFATIEVLQAQLVTHGYMDGALESMNAEDLIEFSKGRQDDWVDEEGKFQWRDKEAVFSFGKYPGQKLCEVRKSDPGYLQWMLRSEFHDDTKRIVRAALNNQFPQAQIPMLSTD
jgi:DNA polymerase-3 subunit epsilon